MDNTIDFKELQTTCCGVSPVAGTPEEVDNGCLQGICSECQEVATLTTKFMRDMDNHFGL